MSLGVLDKVPNRDEIEQTHRRIEPYIHRTPVMQSQLLNLTAGCEIYFKCENFQKAGAFKSRGATNAIMLLNKNDRERGVCTHSSGNHAAALARAASIKGIKAYIVMPENSSKVKIDAVKQYGGIITFCKPNLKSREETLKRLIEKTNAIEIHPYNDYRTIAGQATAAKELLDEVSDPDVIMAPVGGGGLLSGTALSVKYFSPGTAVVGAEPSGADDAYRSFETGKLIPSENPNTIADGLLTSLGTLTFPIILEHVHEILTVTDEMIIKAMKLIWMRMKIIVEPSSAVPFAALLNNPGRFQNKRVGIIVSGGNLDLSKLPW